MTDITKEERLERYIEEFRKRTIRNIQLSKVSEKKNYMDALGSFYWETYKMTKDTKYRRLASNCYIAEAQGWLNLIIEEAYKRRDREKRS